MTAIKLLMDEGAMFPFDGVSQNWQISRAFFAKRQYR